jgi:anaerobic selenocysteine-containing dehydrogenase
VIFNPEIPGPRVGEALPEWWVFAELAGLVKPELADRFAWTGTDAIRQEIAAAVPFYDGIQHLKKEGDNFQYGGPMLCDGWKFDTPDGKASFFAVGLPDNGIPEGCYMVTTRRGKQFNSMVQEEKDPLTKAVRDSVLMSSADATEEGLKDGDQVLLVNAQGRFRGRVKISPVAPGNLQIHWPEAQVLIDHTKRSPEAGIPDYNAKVQLKKVLN